MKALVEIGRTPVEIRDGQGATPLYVAASTDQQQICLYLMSKGANVEVLTHWNARDLHFRLVFAPLLAARLSRYQHLTALALSRQPACHRLVCTIFKRYSGVAQVVQGDEHGSTAEHGRHTAFRLLLREAAVVLDQ